MRFVQRALFTIVSNRRYEKTKPLVYRIVNL